MFNVVLFAIAVIGLVYLLRTVGAPRALVAPIALATLGVGVMGLRRWKRDHSTTGGMPQD